MRKAQRVIKPITSDLRPLTSCLFPLLLVMALLCTSCWREPEYPRQLVEADSAMRWGRYNQADSLIAAYQHAAPKRELRAITRYHQLLVLESKFLHGQPSLDDLLLADSLRAFYGGHSLHDKHAKALAILGDIYHANDDYPSALNSLLHAEEEAAKAGELWLQGIICKELGQVYLDQRMFDDMEVYFRRSQHIATICNDTLRMAHAAFFMGKVCTYQQKLDSIVYYYERAIELGRNINNPAVIVPYAQYELADIYLQMEEFDKASALMPRDTLNDVNWGYWHYQQNHVDSAIYYFKKALHRYNHYANAEYLRILAKLEQSRGNSNQAITYYHQLLETEDSISSQSQVEETRKTEVQHNLNIIKEELQEAQRTSNKKGYINLGLVICSILGITISWRERRLYRKKKDSQIARELQLRQDEERKQRLSLQQIEENNRKIAQLEQQLQQAQRQDEPTIIKQLELDAEQLRMENASIEAHNLRRENLQREFAKSALYQRIKRNSGMAGFKLKEDEWDELAKQIDEVYDDFTNRLLALTPMNITERRVCYLIKMNVKPTNIAMMLNCSGTAVSMARRRLFKKIHKRNGTSKDFDEFVLNF